MLQLAAPSNLLTEYMLKTYVDTFILPIVRQLVLLEQHYETDQTILALAGRDAEIMQKYGVNQVTDEIIDREMMVDINVGMGATDPVSRIQRFIFAIRNYQMLALKPPPGVNLAEIWKEIMALSGYKNGERFTTQGDPDKAKAEQAMQMLAQENKLLKQKLQDKHEGNVVKLQTSRETNAARVAVQEMKESHTNRRLLAEHLMELNMADQNMQPQPQPNQTPQV
jgi:hypothetical protein